MQLCLESFLSNPHWQHAAVLPALWHFELISKGYMPEGVHSVKATHTHAAWNIEKEEGMQNKSVSLIHFCSITLSGWGEWEECYCYRNRCKHRERRRRGVLNCWNMKIWSKTCLTVAWGTSRSQVNHSVKILTSGNSSAELSIDMVRGPNNWQIPFHRVLEDKFAVVHWEIWGGNLGCNSLWGDNLVLLWLM